ncbi:hypothetical protein [Clostridium sp.]|uniref:hypothetical protein n=1 Tax=Clostridium sp. TaxID=1506 RepID=UPI0032170D10
MSWSEQVRLYYDITFSMLTSIVWMIVTALIFSKDMKFSIFILIMISILTSKYLLKKGKKVEVCIAISLIPAIVYEIFSQEILIAILDIIFIALISAILLREINENINYDRYKDILIKGISVIFIASIICSIFKSHYAEVVFRGTIIYLILVVITMRETMGYCYNIKSSKANKVINISLISLALLTTQEFIYDIFLKITKTLYEGFEFITGLIIDIIIKIIENPMIWIINALKKLFAERHGSLEDIFGKLDVGSESSKQIKEVNIEMVKASPVFIFIMNTIVTIILILIVISIIKRIVKGTNINRDSGYTEIVEDIDQLDPGYKKVINKIKKIFRKKGMPREEVLYKYSEFVEVANKKEVFKTYMTPRQLGNVVKIKVDNCEEVDEVTNMYNEAKFSTHVINKSYEQKVEKYVDNIKKNIKYWE